MTVKRKNTRKKRSDEKPFVQFSKKLIAAVMIFWGLIRAFSVVAVWLNPDVGDTMAIIVRGIDEIAMVNCLAYTGNSISEKVTLGYFQMRKQEQEQEQEDDGKEEETSNG